MKKLLSILFLLTLVSCGGGGEGDGATPIIETPNAPIECDLPYVLDEQTNSCVNSDTGEEYTFVGPTFENGHTVEFAEGNMFPTGTGTIVEGGIPVEYHVVNDNSYKPNGSDDLGPHYLVRQKLLSNSIKVELRYCEDDSKNIIFVNDDIGSVCSIESTSHGYEYELGSFVNAAWLKCYWFYDDEVSEDKVYCRASSGMYTPFGFVQNSNNPSDDLLSEYTDRALHMVKKVLKYKRVVE